MTECVGMFRLLCLLVEVFIIAGYLSVIDGWMKEDFTATDKTTNIIIRASVFFMYLILIAVGVWGIFGQIIGAIC